MVDTDMTRFDVVDGPQLRPSIERYEQLGELPPRRRLAFVSWLIGALLVSIAHVSVWASALFAAATGTLPGGVAGGYSVLLLVVYFRSLDDDVTTRRGVNGTSYITEEEQLARVLSVIGPFIAVGEPGERVPSSGAAGLYLDHADWKVVVRDFDGLGDSDRAARRKDGSPLVCVGRRRARRRTLTGPSRSRAAHVRVRRRMLRSPPPASKEEALAGFRNHRGCAG